MDATLRGRSVRRVRQGLVALALGLSTLVAGCHTLDDAFPKNDDCQSCCTSSPKPGTPPPPAPAPAPPVQPGQMPAEASVYFEHTLKLAPDTEHDGQNQPGLVGRLYLFDHKLLPICHDGKMVVKLFDEKPAQGGGEVFLEQWNFDKDSLHKLQQKDPKIGWGYTIFLPTVTCTNPNVKNIRLVVVYTPQEKDAASITVANSMRLEHPEARGRTGQSTAFMPPLPPPQYGPAPQLAPAGYMQQPAIGGYYPQQQQQMPMQYAPQQSAPVYPQQPMLPQQQMPMLPQQQMPPQQMMMPPLQQQVPMQPPPQSYQGLQQPTMVPPPEQVIHYPPQSQQQPAPFPATPVRPLGFQP